VSNFIYILYILWYPAKVLYIVGALQGFLAEHFTPIRKPVCIENMNLLNFPLFFICRKNVLKISHRPPNPPATHRQCTKLWPGTIVELYSLVLSRSISLEM